MSLRIVTCGRASHRTTTPVLICSKACGLQPSTSGSCFRAQIARGSWQRKNGVVVRPVSGLDGSYLTYKGVSHFGDGGQGRRRCYSGPTKACTVSRATRQRTWKSKAGLGIQSQLRGSGGSNLTMDDWKKKLPAKRKALYSHSLPCIEAWLQSLGFAQDVEDRAVWNIERSDWHAQLSLDVTELHIRYLRKGPGKLDRDVERKFSYALSREDLENAILGGP